MPENILPEKVDYELPTACFFFTNEFSISSHRPTFSSWMDTNAPITLKEQMRFYIIKSKKKKVLITTGVVCPVSQYRFFVEVPVEGLE